MLKPYVTLGLISLTIISGAILASCYVSADDVIDQININVPISCSLSGVGMTSHNANINNGTYTTDIGTTTLKAFCNDTEGFSIYAIGFTGDQYTGDDHTKLIGSSTNEKIVTGTATSAGNPDVSNWAMKLSTTTSPTPAYPITITNSFDNYHAVPDAYTKVATRLSSTDVGASATGSELTTTYAAYVSKTQPADTYTGKVKYTLVHPSTETPPLQPIACTSGKICYNPNAYDVVGTMGKMDIDSTATSATLLAANFSREGYGFAGWSDAYDYATNNNAHFYGPQEDITFTAGQYTGTNDGLALYAVWVKSAGDIQSWSGCSSLASGAVTALTDQRDNETYAVAKLADGKCWMIENLRLENTAYHNSDGTLAQGYGTSSTYGNFSGLANPVNIGTSGNINSLYSTDGSNGTINIGTNDAYIRIPNYNNANTPNNALDRPQDPTTNSATNSNSNAGMYSYGNYYTWSAAIANTAPFTTGNQSITNTSICPTGWHLPKGGDKSNEANNEFWALVVTGINSNINPANYSSSTQPYYTGDPEGFNMSKALRTYPNNFVLSGSMYNGLFSARGATGFYWSSTVHAASNRANSYTLYIYNNTDSDYFYVYPGTNNSMKYYGYSIRCLTSS